MRWEGQGQIFWVANRKYFNQKYCICLRVTSMFRIVGSGGKIVAGLHLFTSASAYHSLWFRLTFCSCSPSCGNTASHRIGSIKQFPAFFYNKDVGERGTVFNYLLIVILIILIIHLCILISSSVCLSELTSVFTSTTKGRWGKELAVRAVA